MGPFITYSSTVLSLNLLSYLTREWSCLVPLFICFSIFNTWKMKGSKKWKRPRNTYHVTWCEVDVGGWVGSQLQIPPESMFLTSQMEYSRSCEHLGSCLGTQSWSLVCYLNVDPSSPMFSLCPPDVTHMISASRPCPFFSHFPLSCIILNTNWRTKHGGGLGTSKARDDQDMFCVYAQLLAVVVATLRMVEVPA